MKEYDFGLSWDGNVKERFVSCLKAACRERRLSFLWIFCENVKAMIKKLENGQVKVKVLLDTEATYNKERDPYTRICYAVKDAGGVVINDPDRGRSAVDKSVMHFELLHAGIDTPYSVVIRNWEPEHLELTDEEKKRLGTPFVIKPASGYARLGVVQDAYGSIEEIVRARNFDRGDNFLLQEKITPIELGGKRAWFRVFNVFDKIIPCWWDDRLSWYRHLTYEEFKTHRLFPLIKIVSKIADITRMVWFSTEIAIDEKCGERRFVAIDYVNDQCDMTAKSEVVRGGIPDSIVEYTASCVVDTAHRLINDKDIGKKYTIWFRDTNIVYRRGLEYPPEPLKQATDGTLSSQRSTPKQIIKRLLTQYNGNET